MANITVKLTLNQNKKMKHPNKPKISTKEQKIEFYTKMITKCRKRLSKAVYKHPYNNRITVYEQELASLQPTIHNYQKR